MLDRKWMADREREWKEKDQATQERIVTIAQETARSTKFAAWAQAATVVVGVAAILAAVFFGEIKIEDSRSVPQMPTIVAPTATPESP